jgi:hypothetical protein
VAGEAGQGRHSPFQDHGGVLRGDQELVEALADEVCPCWKVQMDSRRLAGRVDRTHRKVAWRELEEQARDGIQDLHGGGGVVDRG